jgi:hypothetical protein
MAIRSAGVIDDRDLNVPAPLAEGSVSEAS